MNILNSVLTVLVASLGVLAAPASAADFTLEATDFTGAQLSTAQLADLDFKVELGGNDLTGGFVPYGAGGTYLLSHPSVVNNTTVLVTTRYKGTVLKAFGVRLFTNWTVVYDAISGTSITSENVQDGGATARLKYEYIDVNVFAVDLSLAKITDTNTLGQLGVAFDGGLPQAYDQANPSATVLRGKNLFLDVYFGGAEITGFGNIGGIPIAKNVTKAYMANNGNPISSPPNFGTAVLIQYDLIPLNIFAVDLALAPITDTDLLDVIGVSVNGGAIEAYEQTLPTLSVLNGSDVFIKVFFDDENDGLDAGDELLGFTADHAGGIGIASGLTKAYDARNGNTVTVPPGSEQGTALLIRYDFIDVDIFAVDISFETITDPIALPLMGIGVNGNGPLPFDQSLPSLTTLNGSTIFIQTYFDDEGDGLDPGDQLSFEDQSGGIVVARDVTKAYEAVDGNPLTPPPSGTAILIQYDLVPLKVFAVDNAVLPIADTAVLARLGVSVNGGAISSYDQTDPTITVLNNTDVFVKVYFDDEGTGVDAGDELPGWTADHAGGIGVASGLTQAYDAKNGNVVTVPPGSEQGTAILVRYNVLQLNVFAVDNSFAPITDTASLGLMGIGINGSGPVAYNQTGPSIITLSGNTIGIETYFDEDNNGLDPGDQLSFEDQSGGVVVAQNTTKAFEAVDGNPLTVPPGAEQDPAILIQYDLVGLNLFAVDNSLTPITDPAVLPLLGVSINGGPISAYDQVAPTITVINGRDVFVKVYFDDNENGLDPADELTGFTEDHAGGIPVATNLTQAYDAKNGNPIVVPPGSEQGTAILARYDVLQVNVFAVDISFATISNPAVLSRVGVGIDGSGPVAFNQTGPSVTTLSGNTILLKTYFDDEGDGLDLGDALSFEDQSGGVVVAQMVTKAFEAVDGNPLTVPPGAEQDPAILLQFDVIPLNVFAVDTALSPITDPAVLGRVGVSINGGPIAPYVQAAPSISMLNGGKVFLKVYFDDEGTGLDAGDELTGFTEDHAGGIVIATDLTKAFNAKDGNPVTVPPGSEQGTAVLVRYDIVPLQISAVTPSLNLITSPISLARLSVKVNGVGPVPYVQTGPSYLVQNGNKVVMKVYLDGVEQVNFFNKRPAGVGITAGQTLAFSSITGNAIPNPPNLGTAVLIAYDVNAPPVADAGEDQVLECTGPLTTVALDGSGSSDPDGDELTYKWTPLGDPGTVLSTEKMPEIGLPLGDHQIQLTVRDPVGDEDTDVVSVLVLDTQPPVLTLAEGTPGSGDPTLNLELGTPFADPGYTAIDACEGDLTGSVVVSGAVDPDTPGTYELTYEVEDAQRNGAVATRTVNVVVTANSHVMVGVERIWLKSNAQLLDGFASVVDFLPPKGKPKKGDDDDDEDDDEEDDDGDEDDDDEDDDDDESRRKGIELLVSSKAQTSATVTLRAPRVEVKNKAVIAGTLVYHDLVKRGKKAEIANEVQVPASYFPLFTDNPLPEFQAGTPGSESIEVRKGDAVTLVPGAYDHVRVKSKGVLILSGGDYDLTSFKVDSKATVKVLAASTIRVAGQFKTGSSSRFGPAPDADIDASDVLLFVEARKYPDREGDKHRSKFKKVTIGSKAVFRANLYAPFTTIVLGSKSENQGSFIGKEVIASSKSSTTLLAGWSIPGVLHLPPVPVTAPLTKRALAQSDDVLDQEMAEEAEVEFGLGQNYPNPFNPSTTIRYALPEAAHVRLVVYNTLGQEVRVLIDAAQAAGRHAIAWDGRDAFGRRTATGLYIYRLTAGEHVATRKMAFAK